MKLPSKFACKVPILIAAALMSHAVAAADSLARYYVLYSTPYPFPGRPPLVLGFPPEVRVIGGSVDPPPKVSSLGSFLGVDRLVRLGTGQGPDIVFADPLRFFGADTGPCTFKYVLVPVSLQGGKQIEVSAGYYRRSVTEGCDFNVSLLPPPDWLFKDRISFLSAVRRKAIDGSEYDASPMVIEREGLPWMTYFAGYRLGFVASESNWLDSNLGKAPALAGWPTLPNSRDNFELVKLPPPFVEGEVVEYMNTIDFPKSPSGQYFYATTQDDQAALDAVESWVRTGRSFKSGGYVSVCRFYGSAVPGPNTHFYSADDKECNALRSNPVLHYEGQPFRASRPISAAIPSTVPTCPVSTVPLYRAYNNAAGKNYDGNHRYATSRYVIDTMVRGGWVDEGAVMCVPQ